jgi:uncharacterized protein
MEFKTFKMTEFKALEEPGTFTGYAAVFNNRDLGGDVILPGAFAKTLKDKKGRVPFMDNHDSWSGTAKRLGITYVAEDSKGLVIEKGKLILNKKEGMDAWEDMKFYQAEEMPLGISIGYDAINPVVKWEEGTRTRDLKEIALWENSLVTFPMNPKARVRNVKGFGQGFKQLLEDIKAGVLSEEELAELKMEFKELTALLSDGAANEQANAPDTHAEVKLDVEFWQTLNKELKERMKNDRRN